MYNVLLIRLYLLLLLISLSFLLTDIFIFKVGFIGAAGAFSTHMLATIGSGPICSYIAKKLETCKVEEYEVRFATFLWAAGNFLTFFIMLIIVGSTTATSYPQPESTKPAPVPSVVHHHSVSK